MSRSNRHESAPNPSQRWFEWNGADGRVRWYDKDAKKEVEIHVVPPHKPFKFLVLDELACVSGYYEQSKARVFSNEVRDTRQGVLVVKTKKDGVLIEGPYRDIKDRLARYGAGFTSNLYIAFKGDDGNLQIGSLKLRGAAVGQWMDFRRANRAAIYEKAVAINGFLEEKKGRVTFRKPTFAVSDTTADTDKVAIELDAQMQKWITAYLSRTTRDQVDTTAAQNATHTGEPEAEFDAPPPDYDTAPPITDDDIPF